VMRTHSLEEGMNRQSPFNLWVWPTHLVDGFEENAGACTLFSGTCLEELLNFSGLRSRNICSDSHMH
jgi:hypothetical protein